MRSVSFPLRLCVCGAHVSFLQCDVDGVAAACAFMRVLCGGLLFLSHCTALVCGRLGGAGRCEELSVGGCRLRPAHWGLPHTRGSSRQPLAAPGRGLRGWEVCSNQKDNEMRCVTVRLIRGCLQRMGHVSQYVLSVVLIIGAEWRHDIVALCVLCAAGAWRRL
ncbi:elongation factor 1-gamma (EF-1-gamma), putative [Trypanosoma cruzi]|uniref:Elongation factor 1-gamma (EF-1-gamma), putative n=1 Tax=Trypanosoma cruzi (strain CL Brener) TaxID=353153 RepID=Q4E4Y7_TRYCC|nr:elongation factor 1-gamma (EF-1-gamma), putative [Trypanosoma cruzi]EAN99825.1 elongation factor 1-gamma (EF-1-gamma), putative [Trypanosoma cruzi]|eukprot:XP_821676.1 elongation factor 1-gamma (EF-1-gamma) [Trypanosoma cruzi strain CL Brener]